MATSSIGIIFFHKSLRLLFSIWVLNSFCNSVVSQNLLPDGGFEVLSDVTCVSPIQGFQNLQHWYLLDATPDLFVSSCDFEESDFVYWESALDPFEGDNYAGIWSRWNSNDTYFTEGIATMLIEPLKADVTYLFEMAIKNQGTFQGLDGSVSGCELDPMKHIDLYLSADSITIKNDFGTGTSFTDARLVATMDSEAVTADAGEDWVRISTCFKAQGGEQFFGLILPLGTFGELPECALTMATSGVFRSFYYSIDDLKLSELNTSFTKELIYCNDEEVYLNLRQEFDSPLLDSAEFHWDDGFIGVERSFIPKGDISIDAQLNCGSIPISLAIELEDCSIEIYVPNIFSPNNDGTNDYFQVFVSEQVVIERFELIIQDRWGSVVYSTVNPDDSWDGSINADNASSGMYQWRFTLETIERNEPKVVTEIGSVLLMR